jgi:hypothetical protein
MLACPLLAPGAAGERGGARPGRAACWPAAPAHLRQHLEAAVLLPQLGSLCLHERQEALQGRHLLVQGAGLAALPLQQPLLAARLLQLRPELLKARGGGPGGLTSGALSAAQQVRCLKLGRLRRL